MNDTIQFNYNLIDFLDAYLKVDNNLSYSFWLSVVLLFLISLFKCLFSKETGKRDWFNFLLELPIDICTIVTTVIITGFITEETLPHGMMIVVITLIVCAFCSYYRRLALKNSQVNLFNIKVFLFTFLDILFASFWISWVCSSIL